MNISNRLPSEYTTIVMPKKETKPRRKRTAFSNIQLYFLEQFFQKKAYPSSDERNFIASILSIGTGQVKTWFQNRRTKWKKSNYADFEKQTLVETPYRGATHATPWPICNQVLWSPGFPPAPVINGNHGQTTFFQWVNRCGRRMGFSSIDVIALKPLWNNQCFWCYFKNLSKKLMTCCQI